MKVYLIGFMGSGKSTIGKKLAAKLGFQFVDLDKSIEERMGETIQDIFNLKGEDYFRSEETRQLMLLNETEDVLIALGGGTPCREENIEIIRSSGVSVYLKMSANELYSRLSKNRGDRPLLLSLNENELEAYINKTLSEREEYYNQSDLKVSALSFNAEKYDQLIKEIKAYSK